jgi:hypothetical protein
MRIRHRQYSRDLLLARGAEDERDTSAQGGHVPEIELFDYACLSDNCVRRQIGFEERSKPR